MGFVQKVPYISVRYQNSANAYSDKKTAKEGMDQEIPKVFMIVKAYTVADPRAVMVHSHDTSIADGAVVTARRSHDVTLHAVAPVY